ncbi:hypothetical protein SY83_18965 [Paenibacillus swuensis]|uniref:Peptidase S8/S53 domain-containing protein n=1 Tax=Paenibacillus swuensis TaxID=1178515 RepID=A0A172TQJ3_9BACL|nr:hypothetical protein SY83_18965 [Paenibacillus swuensis]
MRKLLKPLAGAGSSKPKRQLQRKVIVFKNARSYNTCLKHMHQHGVRPVKTMKDIHAICFHVDKHQDLSKLHRHPSVRAIETDGRTRSHMLRKKVRIHNLKNRQTTPWGIACVGAPRAWKGSLSGSEVRIAVLDTGIAKHPDLSVSGRFSTLDFKEKKLDGNGHGTHVSGTAAALNNKIGVVGVSPAVRLYGVKVLDSNGEGYVSDLVEGIAWCMKHGIQVVNMSLGTVEGSRALKAIVRKAHRKGVVIIASAGNEGNEAASIDYPAKYKETIAVAASDRKNRVAGYSSRGAGVDVTAPGTDVLSTSSSGGYTRMSGTSMATPHAAGTAALMLSAIPRLSASGVKALLRRTARNLKGYGARSQGAGLINAAAAVRAARIRR